MIDWEKEWPLIKGQADIYGVDPLLIATIRHTENGGPGREFGVLDAAAMDYDKQLHGCCATIRGYLVRCTMLYPGQIFDVVETVKGVKRLVYHDSIVRYIARVYAPLDVANDPTGLNKNWYNNASVTYRKFSTDVAAS